MSSPWQSLYFISAGALLSAFAVALGAFGAHVFRETFTQMQLDTYRTAVQYQFFHAIGMVLAGLMCRWFNRVRPCVGAGFLFLAGIVLFSLSLYALALFEVSWMGVVAPFGGLCFMCGWLLLMWAAHGGWRDA